jgi:hypothetical protein
MATYRSYEAELVDAFLGQAARYTRSGLTLSDCFSWEAFALVFKYGTVLQRSAVRQALLACISLPHVDSESTTPIRHITFEKHLNNWLLHVLRIIADDSNVDNSDRRMAKVLVLVESASRGTQTIVARDAVNRRLIPDADMPLEEHMEQTQDAILQQPAHEAFSASIRQQIEQALKEAFGVEVGTASISRGASDPIRAEKRQ